MAKFNKYTVVVQCTKCGKIYPDGIPYVCFKCGETIGQHNMIGEALLGKKGAITMVNARKVIAKKTLFGWKVKE